MGSDVMSTLIESSTALATLIGSTTVRAISSKIQGLKVEKDVNKIRTEYDEMVNELLQERADAIRLAQTYKEELDKIQISDKDIEHLQNTVSNVLDIVKEVSPSTQIDTFKTLKDLISVDTLKIMQLLGFNYKAAIGEPLTELCAEKIRNLSKKQKNTQKQQQRR